MTKLSSRSSYISLLPKLLSPTFSYAMHWYELSLTFNPGIWLLLKLFCSIVMMLMNQTFCIQLCQWHLFLYCTTDIHAYFIFFFLQQNLQSRDMGCVECMCVMTLLQEHVSCRHSDHHQVLPDLFFELTEWQQAGYKQKLKWTLECDRCDFKTTSKGKMFEHVATHQVSEFSQDCRMRYICWGLLFKQKSSALYELEHILKFYDCSTKLWLSPILLNF